MNTRLLVIFETPPPPPAHTHSPLYEKYRGTCRGIKKNNNPGLAGLTNPVLRPGRGWTDCVISAHCPAPPTEWWWNSGIFCTNERTSWFESNIRGSGNFDVALCSFLCSLMFCKLIGNIYIYCRSTGRALGGLKALMLKVNSQMSLCKTSFVTERLAVAHTIKLSQSMFSL